MDGQRGPRNRARAATGAAAHGPAVAWRRTHGGRILHALPLPVAGAAPRSGPALCGAVVAVDLRHRPAEEETGRERCRRCTALLAAAAGELPEPEPGMLF